MRAAVEKSAVMAAANRARASAQRPRCASRSARSTSNLTSEEGWLCEVSTLMLTIQRPFGREHGCESVGESPGHRRQPDRDSNSNDLTPPRIPGRFILSIVMVVETMLIAQIVRAALSQAARGAVGSSSGLTSLPHWQQSNENPPLRARSDSPPLSAQSRNSYLRNMLRFPPTWHTIRETVFAALRRSVSARRLQSSFDSNERIQR